MPSFQRFLSNHDGPRHVTRPGLVCAFRNGESYLVLQDSEPVWLSGIKLLVGGVVALCFIVVLPFLVTALL